MDPLPPILEKLPGLPHVFSGAATARLWWDMVDSLRGLCWAVEIEALQRGKNQALLPNTGLLHHSVHPARPQHQ